MKYYLVYVTSIVLILSLFMFNSTPKSVPKEMYPMEEYQIEEYQMENYLMLEEETLSQRTDTLVVIPRVIEPNSPSVRENNLDSHTRFDFESILDNINGLITMIIGLINIMTFWFQMRDRKRANQNNTPIEE